MDYDSFLRDYIGSITEEVFEKFKKGDPMARKHIHDVLFYKYEPLIEKLAESTTIGSIDPIKEFDRLFSEFEKDVSREKFKWDSKKGVGGLCSFFRNKVQGWCDEKRRKRRIRVVQDDKIDEKWYKAEEKQPEKYPGEELIRKLTKEEEEKEKKERVEGFYAELESSLTPSERNVLGAMEEAWAEVIQGKLKSEEDDSEDIDLDYLEKLCVLKMLEIGSFKGLQEYLKVVKRKLKKKVSDNTIYINRTRIGKKFKRLKEEKGFYI